MFIFGHIGITLLVVFIVSKIFKIKKLNYFYVALGSILPDLIDKPLGRIILADSIANGRIFAHTLIFALILAIIGIYKNKSNATLLYLSIGDFFHLLEDRMWNYPETLLV